MMKLVIGTEAMFFLSLIMAFVYFSLNPGFKHQEISFLNIRSTGLFSLLLFSSSLTYIAAERSGRKGRTDHLRIWLLVTMLLGLIFLCGQAKEYYSLLNEKQVSIASNTFGTSFFTLTGFHGLHVIAGLLLIGLLIGRPSQAGDKQPAVALIGLYWHFVDIVWLVVFLIVYVRPYLL